jgi:hypothetical protein
MELERFLRLMSKFQKEHPSEQNDFYETMVGIIETDKAKELLLEENETK